MSLLKKFAGETVIYGLGSILPRILFFMLTPYLTRELNAGDYGAYGLMYSFATLLMVFFTYGMETGLFRFGSKENQLNKVFSTAAISLLGTSFIFVGLICLFAPTIASLLNYPEGSIYVKWFAFIIGFDALVALPFAKLRLESRPIKFATIKILNSILLLFFTFFLLEGCPFLIENGIDWIANFYDEDKKVDYPFVANLGASIVIFLILAKDYLEIDWKFDYVLWKKMLTYSLPLVIVGIAGAINRQLDRVFLSNWLLLPEADRFIATGEYFASSKIAILMALFITAFNYAAEPFFFKNADRSDTRTIYAQVGQAFSMVGSVVFLGIMLYMDIIQHFIGENLRNGLDIIPFLLLAFFMLGLFYNFSIWYKLTDNTRIGAWISIGGATITIIFNYIFIPQIGIMAPAYAALVCYTFMAFVSYFIGKKYYPIDYPIGRMLSYIFVAILFYAGSEVIRPFLNEQLALILLVNTLLFLSYIGGLFFLEKETIRKAGF